MMEKQVDVCIVGAGPGGMLLAYLLAKKNVSVLLLESANHIAKTFRGEHINEEGEAILKKYELYEAIEKLGLLKMETLEYWYEGQMIKMIKANPEVGHLGIHVPQAHLLQAILNKAEQHETFEYSLNTRVTALLQDDSGQYIGVKAKKGQQEMIVHSQLVVGADGRHSTVRKQAKIEPTIRKHGYDLLWARIRAPKNWQPAIKMALVDDMQISLFTQVNDFVQIGWNIEPGSYSKLRKEPFEPFIEKLNIAFPQLASSVRENITSWKDFILLDVFSSQTEEWSKSGLALIGDAVHTMTPTGAYGLNCAMKDADLLAQLIEEQQTLERMDLLSCGAMRKDEVAKLQALQVEKEQGFSSQFAVMV